MPVDDLLSAYPKATQVFVSHAMSCAGCVLSQFHTIAEAAAVYHMAVEDFLKEISASIDQGSESQAEQ